MVDSLTQVPEEVRPGWTSNLLPHQTCDLQPQETCRPVTRLVPSLRPTQVLLLAIGGLASSGQRNNMTY